MGWKFGHGMEIQGDCSDEQEIRLRSLKLYIVFPLFSLQI